MLASISPQWLLGIATVVFLLGCAIAAFRPNLWWLALVALLPASVLTIWVVFAPELHYLLPSVF